MDNVRYVPNTHIPEALIGRLLHLIDIGVVIEHLLHLPQVHFTGYHIDNVPAGPQHTAEFLDGQRREAVDEQVYGPVCRRQAVGGGHSELHIFLPLSRQTQYGLGDIDPGHHRRLPGLTQGTIDARGVVALAAAVVQHRRGIAGHLHSELT